MAHAVDPLGSKAGKPFWAGLYGETRSGAEFALALRARRHELESNTLISRKQMRGFCDERKSQSGERKIRHTGLAPVDGDMVRLSAQVYNYSTAKRFDNCLVQFYTIKLDPDTEQEIPPRQLIGTTHISLAPRATAPAQIVWNTKGSAPNGQLYRIYVRLNYDGAIKNENYPPEMPGTLDPGQNNEGFGEVTVMAPLTATRSQPATVSFGATPLAIVWSGKSFTQNLAAPAKIRVKLTSQICTSSDSRKPVDLMVFDGNPSQGHVIAWKRIYVPNHSKCKRTRFSWQPTRGLHQLTAIINPNSAPAKPKLGANPRLTAPPPLTRASLKVFVL